MEPRSRNSSGPVEAMPKHKQAGHTTVLTKKTANIARKRLQCRSHPHTTSNSMLNAAAQLSHCSHSYILQHFGGSNVGLRCGFNRSLGLLQRLLCITNVVRALPSVFPFSLSNKMCRCLWYVPIMKVWKILSWDDCIAQRLSKSSAKS